MRCVSQTSLQLSHGTSRVCLGMGETRGEEEEEWERNQGEKQLFTRAVTKRIEKRADCKCLHAANA